LEKFKEINDIISRLNNQPTSSQICVDNYNSYLTNPSKENKEKLSKSYQQVPKQVRKFILGDMDLKDGPILEIINRSNAD
jgi:ribosomal protein S17E